MKGGANHKFEANRGKAMENDDGPTSPDMGGAFRSTLEIEAICAWARHAWSGANFGVGEAQL